MKIASDNLVKCIDNCTYFASAGAAIGFAFNFIEEHSAAVIGVVTIITYLTSVLFQVLNYRLNAKKTAIDYELSLMKYSRNQEDV